VAGGVPAVEIADHRDMGGVGRPDRKEHAGDAGDLAQIGAEPRREIEMAPLGGKVEIVVGEQQAEAVGVCRLGDAARPGGADAIGAVGRAGRLMEAAARVDHRHGAPRLALAGHEFDIVRAREKGAHQSDILDDMAAEDGKGVRVAPGDERIDVACREAGQSERHRSRHSVGLQRECDSTCGGESSMMQRSEARPRSAPRPAFSGDSRSPPRGSGTIGIRSGCRTAMLACEREDAE
jgi:hypothetical protein